MNITVINIKQAGYRALLCFLIYAYSAGIDIGRQNPTSRRQILTSNVGSHTLRVSIYKHILLAVDP